MNKYLRQISKRSIAVLFTLSLILTGIMGFAQTAYITNWVDSTVSVINVATNTVIDTINVGLHPFGVSVSLDGSKVYVTNQGNSSVSVINTATNNVSATIKVGFQPTAFGNFISTHKAVGIPSYSIEAPSITLYPNPAANQITINLTGSSSFLNNERITLSITNVLGQEIYSDVFNSKQSTVNCKPFPPGMYFLQLKSKSINIAKKFVKE